MTDLNAIRTILSPRAEGEALVDAAPPVAVREIFRRFWPDARPYRAWFGLSLLVVLIGPALEALGIWLFKLVVDEVLVPRDIGPFWWLAAAYLGITLLGAIVSFADDYLSDWVGERFLLRLRTRLFAHLHSLSLDAFDRRRHGDLIARLTGDVAAIESFVLGGVADLLSYVVRILFFGGALFLISWRLALAALVVAPLFWLAARAFSRRIKTASREKRRRSASITSVAEESLSNVALVQAYQRQRAEVARFESEGEGAFAAQMAATRLKALFTPLVDMLELLGGLIVIALGTWELSQGHLTLGALLAFMAYATQLYSPIRGLSRLTNTVYAAAASAERIVELLDEQPRVAERERPVPLRRARGELSFEHLTFAYPETGRPALRDVSLTVGPAETVALVGPSGSGKSTIAKLAVRLYDPDAGAVRLDGTDVRDVALEDLRRNVTLLLQDTLVFHGTIRENLAWARPGATDEELAAAARAADAHDFIARLPHGYDTVVGPRGRKLSGGQRRRLAIARAMIRDAPVLILDEPTTGLDAETTRRVLAPLRRLMADRTTLIISHDLAAVRDADRIYAIEDGRIVESGRHDDLIGGGGAYERIYA